MGGVKYIVFEFWRIVIDRVLLFPPWQFIPREGEL